MGASALAFQWQKSLKTWLGSALPVSSTFQDNTPNSQHINPDLPIFQPNVNLVSWQLQNVKNFY